MKDDAINSFVINYRRDVGVRYGWTVAQVIREWKEEVAFSIVHTDGEIGSG